MNTAKEALIELENTDRRTRQLFQDLDLEQLAVPYHRGINPPVWELGHAAFFYEFFLLRPLGDSSPRMPGFDEIWDSFEIHHRSRWKAGMIPDRQTTFDYYSGILDGVRETLERPGLTPRELYLAKYGIFHQNMHLESLIWARQTLGYPTPASFSRPDEPLRPAPKRDVEIKGGTVFFGIPGESDTFSFDNERPGFEREIEPFAISSQLVTKGEFLEFVRDGGYTDREHWSFGGRQWLEDQPSPPRHPRYWSVEDGEWFEHFFDFRLPLDPEAPMLHVSFWEAEAFCRRAARRLPDEFEWEAAARGRENRLYPWGGEMETRCVDMDATRLGRLPTGALPEGATEDGCLQMLGTAWEWTTSQFLPYDGFTMDMYPYMSTLQFGDHKTTRGGSCATSSCLIRATYRQAYLPGRNDVFTGFRTVRAD